MPTASPQSGSRRSPRPAFAPSVPLALALAGLLAGCGGGEVAARGAAASPVAHLFDREPLVVEALAEREAFAGLFVDEPVWVVDQVAVPDAWEEDPQNAGFERFRLRVAATPPRRVGAEDGRLERDEWRDLEDGRRLPEAGEVLLDKTYLRRRAGDGASERLTFDHPTPPGDVAELLGLAAGPHPTPPVELTLGPETRRTRTTPVGQPLVHQVRLPERARLHLGAAVRRLRLRLDDAGAGLAALPRNLAVVLRVRVEQENGSEAILWEQRFEEPDLERWLDVPLDLERWSGELVRLHFESAIDQGAIPEWTAFAAWGEPVVWSATQGERPNLLLIQVDTLRADRLGAYGWERARTPNLDALAARGVRFADAMSAASWTLPSHASMFTSTYPSQHGLWKRQRLPEQTVTVAEVLRAGGYRTAAFAERGFLNPSHGFARGFDRFNSLARDFEITFDLAEGWLKEEGPPFFAFVQTYKVHAPYNPAPEFRDGFVTPYPHPNPYGELAEGLRAGAEAERPADELITHLSELYDAEIAELDHYLGGFLERLELAGVLDDTLLIVTSDHGEEFYDHGGIAHGGSLYQEQLHVPLIVHQPGHFEGGLVVERPVHGVDLAPTLVAAAGLEAPQSWVGLPLSLDPVDEEDRPLFVPMRVRWTGLEERKGEPAAALRLGSLKYVDYPDGLRFHDEQTGPRLYDLATDPGERTNLLDATLQAEWAERAAEARRRYPPLGDAADTRVDEDLQRELEALGYAGDDED